MMRRFMFLMLFVVVHLNLIFVETTSSDSDFILRDDNCDCGIASHQSKIVGGKTTIPNEYPWMVSLHYTFQILTRGLLSTLFCGGSLISTTYVLTAAHCVLPYRNFPFMITVNIGDHDLKSTSEATSKRVIAIQITSHPMFNKRTLDNDIALIKLISAVPLDGIIRPVCLPPPIHDMSTRLVTASGWGKTTQSGYKAPVLMDVTVPTISNSECQEPYSHYDITITSRMLCAGESQGGKDSCQGDSGGPLVTKYGKRYVIVGIVSFGIGCGRPGLPGVYTRVSEFIPWIQQTSGIKTCGDHFINGGNITTSNQ